DVEIEIGKSRDPFWSGYTGFLDEFRIYNRVISSSEIVTLAGGVVQPALSILLNGNQLTLSWSASGFVLQANTNLGNPSGWADVAGNPSGPFIVALPKTGMNFYRLKKVMAQ